jgi:hypothetical protein
MLTKQVYDIKLKKKHTQKTKMDTKNTIIDKTLTYALETSTPT